MTADKKMPAMPERVWATRLVDGHVREGHGAWFTGEAFYPEDTEYLLVSRHEEILKELTSDAAEVSAKIIVDLRAQIKTLTAERDALKKKKDAETDRAELWHKRWADAARIAAGLEP